MLDAIFFAKKKLFCLKLGVVWVYQAPLLADGLMGQALVCIGGWLKRRMRCQRVVAEGANGCSGGVWVTGGGVLTACAFRVQSGT